VLHPRHDHPYRARKLRLVAFRRAEVDMKRVRIDSHKAIAAHLAKLWGRSVSAPSVSGYAHPDREHPLPLKWDPIGISWIYVDELEAWAKRREQRAARAAAKRKRSTSRR
jgi:hypothetical protein